MGQHLENWSRKMVMHRAAKQRDKIIEQNGKIYIFSNKGNEKMDKKPNIYNDWEDAGSAYNIFEK